MIWYFENPQRFRQEREALDRLASGSAWLIPGEWRMDVSFRVAWDANIIISDRTYPVTIQYPNHFPHSPPLVLPRESEERWSSHQYGAGGELCLEFGPDNWHPDLTGAEMIESAHRLLEGETHSHGPMPVVQSRHATTLGQNLRGRRLRLLVTRDFRDIIATLPEQTPVEGKLIGMYHEESVVFAVTSLALPDGTEWIDNTIPQPIKYETYERQMVLVRWPLSLDVPSAQAAKDLRNAINAPEARMREAPYLFIARGETIYGHRLWDEDDTISEISVIPPQPVAARLDEMHSCLGSRRVAVIGCGSLGSKIAVILARCGVGNFLLVDADVMLPDNLVRHDVDWRDIGTHKAAAVARKIRLVNPGAECQTRRDFIGGQESSGSIETLIGTLAECDLIVDATADAHAFGYLCAAASAGSKPVVWAQVFGGGFGGLVARHRPLLEPGPASMRRAIEQWCTDQGMPIARAANYETRDAGPPLIADDADVTVIAAHASRLTIDTLMQRTPSMFPYSAYMIGLAQGWIFDQPFDTRPIDVGPPVAMDVAPADQEVVAQEMALVIELFRKHSSATAPNSSDHTAPET